MRSKRLVRFAGILLVGSAAAQGSGLLGKDDAVFADRLFQRGYTDLAEGICRAILEDPTRPKKDAVEARSMLFDLRLTAARSEPDLAKRKELLATILKDADAFLKEHEGDPAAQRALSTSQEVTLVFGETLAAMLQREDDPELFNKLRKEGEDSFKRAEGTLRERIDEIQKQLADPNLDYEKLEERSILTSYNLARTLYFHSLIYPPGELRKIYVERALDAFRSFGLDYGDQLLAYDGLIYQGLCNKGLEKPEAALRDFDDAIALRESWEKDAKGVYRVPGPAADIISSAVLQKILLLTERKDHAAAVAAGKDYLASLAAPLEPAQGLAVLAAVADAELAQGHTDAAVKAAQELVDADARGPWGARGREIQGRAVSGGGASGLDTSAILAAAQALAVQGDYARALTTCRRARVAARGTPSEANTTVESWLLVGSIYARQGFLHEAALAFDVAVETEPKAEKASEALYRALNAYIELFGNEANPYYRTLAEERKRRLSSEYSGSLFAAKVQLLDGKQLEAEQRFAEAAELYQRVTKESPDYDEARFRAGNCLLSHARVLLREGKAEPARAELGTAEGLLQQAIASMDTVLGGTIDRVVQAQVGGLAFSARIALVQLYLTPELGRVKDALPVLDQLDLKYATDPERIARVWSFRIQALEAIGKVDEAVAQLEILRRKDPQSPSIAPASRVLARALDLRAVQKLTENPQSVEGETLWRQSSTYYLLGVAPQLEGRESPRPDDLETFAGRLFVIGLHFNRVPEGVDSFVGFDQKRVTEPIYWERAAELYERCVAIAPSYLDSIQLGRCLGFLGRWEEAARTYERMFEEEPLIDEDTKRFKADVLASRPELPYAYLEWGVAEHSAGKAENDRTRMARAVTLFERLTANTKAESKVWWQATYFQVRAMTDRGDYDKADFVLRDIERNTNGFPKDGGLDVLFVELKNELQRKVFR